MLIKDRLEFEYIYCAFEALIVLGNQMIQKEFWDLTAGINVTSNFCLSYSVIILSLPIIMINKCLLLQIDYSIPRSLLHMYQTLDQDGGKPDDFLEQKFAHHFFLS